MPSDVRLSGVTPGVALSQIRTWLRDQLERRGTSQQRLQFSLNTIVELQLEAQMNRQRQPGGGPTVYRMDAHANSEPYQDAVWELVGRGIVRPVATRPDNGRTTITGTDFVVTSYGERWVAQTSPLDEIPSEGDRFSAALAGYAPRFGPIYHSRSQEALACYQGRAYLGCCSMCGAASEAILLHVAVAKRGEDAVNSAYRSANGRSRVETMVTGQLGDHLRVPLLEGTALLKYWRDAASHATASRLSEPEAFMSMLLLLRFAIFVDER